MRAVSTLSDQALDDFLIAGGKLRSSEVEYAGKVLPLDSLGQGFWVLRHLRLYLEAGGDISPTHDGEFLLTSPSGLLFTSRREEVGSALSVLAEVFVLRPYDWLEVENRVVIDIGANIGDTALYFRQRGAAHVYAYEPVDAIYRAALRNVELNGADNVTLVHGAIGPTSTRHEAEPVYALGEVIEQGRNASTKRTLVCKVDCEGCEHEIFRPAVADFSSVEQWIIEVHGFLGDVPATLGRAGFKVSTHQFENVWMVRAWK